MPENKTQKIFQKKFSPHNKALWQKAATSELNGSEPFTTLKWNLDGSLEFFPYYDRDDLKPVQNARIFDLQPSHKQFTSNRAWLNTPLITVTNEVSANKIALEHLANGADAILFDFQNKTTINVPQLIDSIQWEYCSISFMRCTPEIYQAVVRHLSTDITALDGGEFFWDRIPQSGKNFFSDKKKLRSLGVWIEAPSISTQLVETLTMGVNLIEEFRKHYPVELVLSHIVFSLPVGSDFFADISKLKALRLLWYQIARAYGVESYEPHNLHIHTRSSPFTEDSFQPHGSMLKSTTAAMAAVCGGADAITVLPEDENNPMMRRVARNVSSVLREESYFDKVADPLAGAYIIDVMIEKIAKAVWKEFQSKTSK